MATWSSNPSVPNTGGTFNFPPNTTNETKNYTITYIDDNGCTANTIYSIQPCPVITACSITLTSLDGKIPCDCSNGKCSSWIFDYEVTTTTNGVTAKTAEGTATANFTVESNCNGSERTISINKLSFDSLIDGSIDLLIEYSDCEWKGTFTQEGASDVMIQSCSDIKWSANGITSDTSRVYNHYTNDTFTIYPIMPNGSAVECKSSSISFYINGFAPSGSGDPNVPGNWTVNCKCCPEPIYCTGGTSGSTTATGAYLSEVFVTQAGGGTWGLSPIGSTASLTVSEKTNNTISLSYRSDNGHFSDSCCNNSTPYEPVGIGALITFEIYKNQTTKTGNTITCTFDIYYNLASYDA